MDELAAALPLVAFWAVVGVLIWVQHRQYMAGEDNAEVRLRDAIVRKREAEAELAEWRTQRAKDGDRQ